MAIIGPTRCGKTAAAIGGILDWTGPAILSSVKSDLMAATIDWLYAAPTVPPVSGEAVVITGGPTSVNANTLGAPIIELVPPTPPPEVLIDVPSMASTANSDTVLRPKVSPDSAAEYGPLPVPAAKAP